MARCQSVHPEDRGRRCLMVPGDHHSHTDAQGAWPNPEVQERERVRRENKTGKKPKAQRQSGLLAIAAAVASNKATFNGTKSEGMAMAASGTPAEFKAEFLAALREVAVRQPSLISDDVWAVLEAKGVDTESRAAVGPLMATAAKYGWTQKTDERRVSSRPLSKSRDGLTVWRSLIHDGVGSPSESSTSEATGEVTSISTGGPE